jgi:hypothetical protein
MILLLQYIPGIPRQSASLRLIPILERNMSFGICTNKETSNAVVSLEVQTDMLSDLFVLCVLVI